jgi:hypothetical protein
MAISWIDLDEFAWRFGVEFEAGNLSLEFSGVVQIRLAPWGKGVILGNYLRVKSSQKNVNSANMHNTTQIRLSNNPLMESLQLWVKSPFYNVG